MVSPISWGHHYTLVIPATLFVSLWLLHATDPATACTFAAAMAALVILHYAGSHWARNTGLLGLGTGLWLASALLIATSHSLRHARLRSRYDSGLKTSPESSFG